MVHAYGFLAVFAAGVLLVFGSLLSTDKLTVAGFWIVRLVFVGRPLATWVVLIGSRMRWP